MKKVFKKIGIVVIVIVALVIAYQVYIVISDKVNDYNVKKEQEKLQEERRNAKTLMEYIRTHESPIMYFSAENLKCDALDNIKIFTSDYFITKDNEIYDVSFNELYSNNQNCKKREINIDIKNIQDDYIFSKDNKIYNIKDLEEQWTTDYLKIYLMDKDIKKIINSDYNYDIREVNILVLKNNNIYKQVYNLNDTTLSQLKHEEIYKSLEEYGNIQEIVISNYYTSNSGKNYQLEDNTIEAIISDKGYYYLDEVKTDECIKYKDIECKLELKESEIYKRFSKDIKFIGKQYTILSDNSIIETRYLTYPLDKDLKN